MNTLTRPDRPVEASARSRDADLPPISTNLPHVLVRGRQMTARADVIEEPAVVAAEVARLIARLGAKEASRQLYMELDVTPPPTREQLAQALHGVVVVRITPERSNGSQYAAR